MSKAFFDVFPTLRVHRQLHDLFEETQVERVTTNSDHSKLRIYMSSGHLIEKTHVLRMQREIARQLMDRPDRQVYITERYTLPGSYHAKELMEAYRASLLCEMENASPVMGRIFAGADITFPEEDEIRIRLKENALSREKAPRMTEGIESIFLQRFGIPVRVTAEFVPAGDGGVQKPRSEEAAVHVRADSEESAVQKDMPQTVDLPWDEAPLPAYIDVEEGPDGPVVVTKKRDQAPPEKEAAAEAVQNPHGSAEKGKGARKKHPFIFSDRDDVLFGRAFEGDAVPLESIIGETGDIIVRGRIFLFESRNIKNNKSIVIFSITDLTDSITCKIFVGTEDLDELSGYLKEGTFVRIRGKAQLDTFDSELVFGRISGIMKGESFLEVRQDNYVNKRVELHCHTKMSDMDGVSECKDLVKRAYTWGMPAIAITDHGNVQAFPDAFHMRTDLLKEENGRRKEKGLSPVASEDFFKVIYGVECYLVDDLKKTVDPGSADDTAEEFSDKSYVVFDLETTGFSPVKNRIIEIGAVKIENGRITDRFSCFVNPQEPIPYHIQKLTQITDDMVKDADTIGTVLPEFLKFCGGCRLVGHNVGFDIGFVKEKARALGIEVDITTVDTEGIARILLPGHARYTLDAVAKLLEVELRTHHRAVDDAEATAGIFLREMELLRERGTRTFTQIEEMAESNEEIIKRLHMSHCVLLVQNETGRVNLYKLISDSHLKYFFKKPRIPKSELMKHREGLLVGSACVAGELFEALLETRSDETIARIVDFYDYLEIQPRDNNRFLLDEKYRNRYPDIQTEEDLLDLNRRIVQLGETMGKPVVATGDVHFMDPADEIYRTIIQDGIGLADEESAPLYFKTTDEMMQEFSYLGAEKAKEVVITNTQKIADMIDVIAPVRPDKCPPVIPDSDNELRRICYDRAHAMYGDPLPAIVQERLEKELHSIISNGYSVMYIIAQKLVWKSVEDGYLVGSRGSVGSSFVATMAGITEVNPLSPHYYCPSCHYSDFDSEEVRAYSNRCGIDMPAKMCPKCGKPLKKDGFGIPFETFLGFHGDKEPDIDLNFSGEYQSKAHRYTEVIFGAGQTFKAGTIATVADKTAYGFVKNYYARKEVPKRRCELDRLAKGCVGIRRSTGQHPGGIVVLPLGEDINTFTPVQHPANDMTSDIITTHFDYHSIDHNLLKLDILGHDDPTMIRMLQDLTGIEPTEIPLDDAKVMSLFRSTEALGITPEQNGGIPVGILGIPEFGTKFVIGIVEDTKPTTMSELVRISGLSHGTNVWLDNAQYYIKNGFATLSTAICTRDDIMTFLIHEGMENATAFKIMESVRKGKGLKPDMKEAMRAANIPDWYLESCEKISYMFPKAHAAAYVMMALRIAYCKVYYPQAYYAAYFSIRASAFDYELMCEGQGKLLALIDEYEHRPGLPKKDQDTLEDMYIVREMYARGIEFMPVDLTLVGARNFRVIDGRIMPSLTSIQGMGVIAAQSVVDAVKDGPFLSKDDFKNRTKVSATLIDKMQELGMLGDIPETNQMSIFDILGH